MSKRLFIIFISMIAMGIIGFTIGEKRELPKQRCVETMKDTITILVPPQNLRDLEGNYMSIEMYSERQNKGYQFLIKQNLMDDGKLIYECVLVKDTTK